ncbi:nucleotide-binding protein [Helicobacter pylori]|uniref:nucleotide-binding protein n=1 Tax=Helicobacter pylori TaxID=210 RepID=UPI0009512678|nr:division plane positioning ATPase MipZ [Helicobacter pylori]OLR44623.1 hypothetical protein BIZ44_00055 [Helicobacter pylori]OLR46899.1 hypothetical protein BIZ50_04615 [Helicobacter pylori]
MIITIANEKGGSGKSTLCLNLCVQLLLDKKDIAALDTIPTLKEKKALIDFINQNNANESVFLMDNLLSERIAYKRSVSEGMGVMEYNDNKAKNEWSQFYDELIGYLGGKK